MVTKLSNNVTAEIYNNGWILLTKNYLTIHTTTKEIEEKCKKANQNLADSITLTQPVRLDGAADYKTLTLTDTEINTLVKAIKGKDLAKEEK